MWGISPTGVANQLNIIDQKAEDCRKAVEDLKQQELDLQRQKLDNIDKYYNHKIDRLEAQISKNDALLDRKGAYGEEIFQQDYVDAIKATRDKIAQLQAERKAYADQFDALVKSGVLQPDSNEWHEYISTLEEVDESIIETQTDLAELKEAMANIELTNLQYALDRLEALQDALEGYLDFHDAQGVDNDPDTYIDLIQNAFDEIDNLEKQNKFLRGQQEGLDVLSEKWQELQQEIESNEQSIWDIKSAQEDWNDTIADLQIQMLERERKELEKTNEALEKRKEMEDALEDLEKAKSQRTKLIYREGIGFVYEADQEAIKEAQDRVDELRHQSMLDKIDEVIESIEDNKRNDNIYDFEGSNIIKDITDEDALKLYNMIHDSTDLDALLADKAFTDHLKNLTSSPVSQNVIQIGDIVLEGVQDANSLAQSIVTELPNRLIQALYK